jgi:hypothetical protein
MDVKHKTCDIRNVKTCISRHVIHQHWYLCPIALQERRKAKHRSFWLLFQWLQHLRFNHFVSSLPPRWIFSGPNRWKSLDGNVRAVRQMFKNFPLYFLDSLLFFSDCMGSGIVKMKQQPSRQLAWTFSADCIPKLSRELESTMQNSHFHHPSENGLAEKHDKHNLPSWWSNRKLRAVVEGELGCFHCIEARFDSGR